MQSLEKVLMSAREYLRVIYGDGPPTIVVEPHWVKEYPNAWSVVFDTQEHIDTGDFTQAPLQRVVIVPKDGSPAHIAPTPWPVSKYLDMVASGEISWSKPVT